MSNIGEEKISSDKIWWVYIVKCSDGSLYTGCTIDISRRLRQHNGEIGGGAKYTAPRRPVRIVGLVESTDRSSAQKLESRIKKMKRVEKIAWCEKNPAGLIA